MPELPSTFGSVTEETPSIPPSETPLLFISYTSEDAASAAELRRILIEDGNRTWMAPDDIRGPRLWAEQIVEAITSATMMVVVVSSDTMQSSHVSREVNLALDQGKAILPIRIEDAALSGSLQYLLALVQWTDAFPPPLLRHKGRFSQRIADLLKNEETARPARQSPLPVVVHNLPVHLSSFIGRTQELAELAKLLAGARLLTVTGVGGSGKTRLALEAAAAAIDQFPDGVRLIELAAVGSADLVVPAVCDSVGVQGRADQPLLATLAHHFRTKRMLLIVDNCEHLLQPVADTVKTLLEAAPGLRILATSRQRLTVGGEVTYPIHPMPIPSADMVDLKVLMRVEAVALFASRAETARPGFRVTPDNASAVNEICRRLDGIPLAIELAAARLGSLSPQQIASHLDQRLRILTLADRTAPPHQQTLRSTIDWSYELLSPSEQTLFQRLSVFRGSFSLEAAQQICNDTALRPLDVVDLLPDLVERSLVTVNHSQSGPSYRLLETIREYALEHFAEGGNLEQLQRRHAHYYLNLAEEAEPHLRTAKKQETLQHFEAANDNYRQILQWALDTGETETGLRLAGALSRFWFDKPHILEGRNWLDALLNLPSPVSENVRAKALLGAGTLANEHGDKAHAIPALEEAADIYRKLASQGQPHAELAAVLNNLAVVLDTAGDHLRAGHLYEEALTLHRQYGNQWGIATTLGNLGIIEARKGNLDEAGAYAAESISMSRELGPSRLGDAHYSASAVDLERGDFKAAISNLERAADNFVEAGVPSDAAYIRAQLGHAHLEAGDVDRAIELFIPNASSALADPEYQARAGHVAELAMMRAGLELAVHNPERAAILLGAIDHLVAEGTYVWSTKTLARYREANERLLNRDTLEETLARGATMTPEELRSFITEGMSPTVAASN